MKVYALLGNRNYEGSELLGVFATLEELKNCATSARLSGSMPYYNTLSYKACMLDELNYDEGIPL